MWEGRKGGSQQRRYVRSLKAETDGRDPPKRLEARVCCRLEKRGRVEGRAPCARRAPRSFWPLLSLVFFRPFAQSPRSHTHTHVISLLTFIVFFQLRCNLSAEYNKHRRRANLCAPASATWTTCLCKIHQTPKSSNSDTLLLLRKLKNSCHLK